MSIFRKLRIKIILITAGTLAFVLYFMLFFPLKYVYAKNLKQVNDFLQKLQDTQGHILFEGRQPSLHYSNEKIKQKNMYTTPPQKGYFLPDIDGQDVGVYYMHNIETESDYFCLKTDKTGEITEYINDYPLKYSEEVINAQTALCIQSPKDIGQVGCVFYNRKKTDYGYFIACVDRSETISYFIKTTRINTLIFWLSIVVGLLIPLFFSYILVRPVEKIFLRQQQFVADASHELKTPIAAIRANIDVLFSDFANNKWLQYIKSENIRMEKLVHDLLYLAKIDAKGINAHLAPTDVNEVLESTVLPLESLIYEQGKKLEFSCQKGAKVIADFNILSQLIVILVDNAIKNSTKGSLIRITCATQNTPQEQKNKNNKGGFPFSDLVNFNLLKRKKLYIKVFNTGSWIKACDLPYIFDRFFRADSSRTRSTGGYGLGLSIAKKLATSLKSQLYADSKEGQWAQFTLVMPLL